MIEIKPGELKEEKPFQRRFEVLRERERERGALSSGSLVVSNEIRPQCDLG